MSGIFKGDSIYKSGGGGGGYKDGGALVDGDFIRVENNSISTYENTTRSEINFYVELKQGDTLNTIIELTNNYNATVFFWVLNPETGILTPIGNIGGDTINSGEEYNIQATGNSYTVDQVSTPTPDPNYYVQMLYGAGCRFKKIGDYFWQQYNNVGVIPGVRYIARNNTVYYNAKDIFLKNNHFDNGYELPNSTILQNLYTSLGKTYSNAGEVLKDVNGWKSSSYPGDNSAELNFQANGAIIAGSDFKLTEWGMWIYRSEVGSVQCMEMSYSSYSVGSDNVSTNTDTLYIPLRFIKHV